MFNFCNMQVMCIWISWIPRRRAGRDRTGTRQAWSQTSWNLWATVRNIELSAIHNHHLTESTAKRKESFTRRGNILLLRKRTSRRWKILQLKILQHKMILVISSSYFAGNAHSYTNTEFLKPMMTATLRKTPGKIHEFLFYLRGLNCLICSLCLLVSEVAQICNVIVQFQIKIRKINRRRLRSTKYAELRPRPHESGYFWIRKFFFPDTATVHTHPTNSTANPNVSKSALQSGKKLNPQRIR